MLKALSLPHFFSVMTSAVKTKKQFGAKTSESAHFRMGMVLLAVNILLLMTYVVGVNSSASKGFEIKSLQIHMDRLSQENRQLSLKVAESSSMVSIQSDFLSAHFTGAGTPKFLLLNPETQLTKK